MKYRHNQKNLNQILNLCVLTPFIRLEECAHMLFHSQEIFWGIYWLSGDSWRTYFKLTKYQQIKLFCFSDTKDVNQPLLSFAGRSPIPPNVKPTEYDLICWTSTTFSLHLSRRARISIWDANTGPLDDDASISTASVCWRCHLLSVESTAFIWRHVFLFGRRATVLHWDWHKLLNGTTQDIQFIPMATTTTGYTDHTAATIKVLQCRCQTIWKLNTRDMSARLGLLWTILWHPKEATTPRLPTATDFSTSITASNISDAYFTIWKPHKVSTTTRKTISSTTTVLEIYFYGQISTSDMKPIELAYLQSDHQSRQCTLGTQLVHQEPHSFHLQSQNPIHFCQSSR